MDARPDENIESERAPAADPRGSVRFGLSARLLVLTGLFVMLAEVLIYVPSVANFRRNWLNDRLAAAQVAGVVLEAVPPGGVPSGFEEKLLAGVGARAVAVRVGGARRLLATTEMPPEVGRVIDLRDAHWVTLIADAFETLVFPAQGPVRVIGAGKGGADFVEIVMDERPLRVAMLTFSRNILILSLAISGITAFLVYLALHLIIVRPVRRLAANVTAFEHNPEDAERVIRPSERRDEIGEVERALALMQETLSRELLQKKHLANLGLAVSKVNHDLRNLLASAQLLSDRLSQLSDPTVRRVAPKLIATLGRAIAFCEATLAYGRAAEPQPRRRVLRLAPLVRDLADFLDLAGNGITFLVDMDEDITVDADPDQLSRILINLGRNAVQALAQAGAGPSVPTLTIAARRDGRSTVIRVADNGPGVPAKAREHLFEAFQGTSRRGGVGLGLAITAELVALHGGHIVLEEEGPGASFRIHLPDRTNGNGA